MLILFIDKENDTNCLSTSDHNILTMLGMDNESVDLKDLDHHKNVEGFLNQYISTSDRLKPQNKHLKPEGTYTKLSKNHQNTKFENKFTPAVQNFVGTGNGSKLDLSGSRDEFSQIEYLLKKSPTDKSLLNISK